MKILFISPTYFSKKSFIGGGERYAYDLAKAMSKKAEVLFLSFAEETSSYADGNLKIEYINKTCQIVPFSLEFLKFLYWSDVIHCFQAYNFVTDISVIFGKILKKKIFITDIGGGSKYSLSYHLPILRQSDGFFLISEYSRNLWKQSSVKLRPDNLNVIYGGVDTEKFSPDNSDRSETALFVGRLLPHKGIDYLIDAVTDSFSLDIVGNVYNERYFNLLKEKSRNKAIKFHTDTNDEKLVQKYRNSLVTVLPSVYKDCYGNYTNVPELFGLVVLESMACGTPAIVTDVGSLPEIVDDGVTGFIVPPNDPSAIHDRIEYLRANSDIAHTMGIQGRKRVMERFTWDVVANKCIEFYGQR